MNIRLRILFFVAVAAGCLACPAFGEELGEDGFADSDGVKIHYVTQGEGPLMILIHGFPDFWYSWRDQMPSLAKHFQVVAIDQRGYNKSDQPEGVANYRIEKLVADVDAVRRHFKRDKVTVVGHDWGGFVAWTYAMAEPEHTERLVVLNCPHPNGLIRELTENPAQHEASAYARNFQKPDAAKSIPAAFLAGWVKEADARKKYAEALSRSSVEGMLNYYKANYPKPPYKIEKPFPPVKCPVLIIYGLKDKYLLSGALNGTWQWVERDLTIVTVPEAAHFVHRDKPEFVTRTMLRWLTDRPD